MYIMSFILFLFYFIYLHTTIYNTKSTVCLSPQIAKANCGGQSYMQSVVKLDNYYQAATIQQYNNLRSKEWKQVDIKTKTGG